MKATCMIDGEPSYLLTSEPMPDGVRYVGMESYPNGTPRYGKLNHPWFNLPCYETIKKS